MQETEYINVYGARVHNLKDIDAADSRQQLDRYHRIER